MLVAPVRLELRLPRKLEIEVGRPTSRSCGAGEHDTKHVRVLVVVDQSTESEQLASGPRREPTANVCRGTVAGHFSDARVRRAQLLLDDERVVRTGLDVREQAVEGRHVDAGCIEATLER